ncbi:unnamed protein product [Adineta steineri]|uniref:Uncharacterized protein n=1 Tax=Adineta steineri TaxID=433720 RepID=A0A814IIZ4_9BILA|nr:unnamed protein product [Adineta steineri]
MTSSFLVSPSTPTGNNRRIELAVVQLALDQAISNKICLTIAHHLSIIQNSQKVVVIAHGKMKESAHDELLKLNGIYKKLTLAQER